MKKIIVTFIIVSSIVAILTSCSKNKQALSGSWSVESMRVHKDSVLMDYPRSSDSYGILPYDVFWLTFQSDNSFELFTKEAAMYGRVRAGVNKIDFKSEPIFGGNFKKPFVKECVNLLINNITHYNVNDSILVLKGKNGEVINLYKR